MDAAMEGSRWTCTDTVLEMVVVELRISPKSGPNLSSQSVLSPVHESRVQLYTYPSRSQTPPSKGSGLRVWGQDVYAPLIVNYYAYHICIGKPHASTFFPDTYEWGIVTRVYVCGHLYPCIVEWVSWYHIHALKLQQNLQASDLITCQ